MPSTANAMLGRFQGSSWAAAFGTNSNPQNLDLIQIVDEGDLSVGAPVVRVNVTSTGVVNNPAVNPTNGTNVGVFYTRLGQGASTASYFADAFTDNPAQQDILQLASPSGGNILNYIDYQGVSH